MSFNTPSFISFLDNFTIILLVLFLYKLIRKTGTVRIILGFLIIIVFSEICKNIGLTYTSYVLSWSINFLLFALVIIYHHDIRLALNRIGGLTKLRIQKDKTSDKLVSELKKASFFFSANKIGALIVLDRNDIIASQSNNLTSIDANCKSELLQTIFYPNTPLHDGATLINDGRISFAGCKLPLNGEVRNGYEHFGTRHLVAIETAEKFEVTVIVVSEETGNISIIDSKGIHNIETEGAFLTYFEEK